MIIGIIGFAGLAVDVSYLKLEKRMAQSAADGAAMGALREMELGNTDLVAAGQNDAALNGFTDGQNNTTVTINNPPSTGDYSGVTTAVEAIVQRQVSTYFMSMLGAKSVTVAARSIAQTTTTQGSVGACIFAMDKTANNTFVISGSSTVTTACGIVVNSTSSKAFVNSGGGHLNLANGAQIGVVGTPPTQNGWDISGGSTVINSTTSQSELPVNIKSFSDPLANVTAPTPGSITTGVKSSNTLNIDSNHMPAGNALNPGIYCNGISIQSTNGTLTFNAGTYIIAGGGLVISSNSTVTGTGVMFYNTRTTATTTWGCSATNYNAKEFKIQGGLNSVTFTAPTNQSPVGVLYFEDRNLPSALSNQITGGSIGIFNGAIYCPKSYLTFSGGSSATNGYLMIVADTVTISGTSNLGNDHTDLSNVNTLAPGTTGGGLVE